MNAAFGGGRPHCGLLLGGDDDLVKPPDELVAPVVSLLRRSEDRPAAPASISRERSMRVLLAGTPPVATASCSRSSASE